MPRYDYVLFDADNTLFDFDRAEAEALLIGAAIALGTALGLGVTGLIGGGGAL